MLTLLNIVTETHTDTNICILHYKSTILSQLLLLYLNQQFV